MRTRVLGLTMAAISVLAVPAQGQERFTLSGDRLAVYNLAGTMEVVAGSGSGATVEVTRQGRDGSRLRVEQGPIRDRATLRVIYPDADIRYGGNQSGSTDMRVRSDGTFNDGDRGRDGRRVRISSQEGDVEAWADLRISIPADRQVEVYLGVGHITATNVAGKIRLDASSAGITVRGARGELMVDTGSGDVDVTDVDGPLSIDTGSGSVHAARARNGEVSIDTGSGDVEAEDISSPRVNIDTGSGGVRLGGLMAESLMVDTGSGDVEVALTARPASLEVDTGSGSVRLYLPADIGATVHLDTSSGDLETDFPLTITRKSQDELRGTVGDGAGRITVSTGSGDIALLRAGKDG